MHQAPEGAATILEDAHAMAERMAAAAGGSMRAVVLYGSHLLGARPDRHSALDFVVLVDDYARFYRALKAAGEIHRSPGVMTVLARILPPNVIAFTPEEGAAGVAKCLILTVEDFEDAIGEQARDHFLIARMVQRVAVIWSMDPEWAHWVEERLARARAGVLRWTGPFLTEPFDAEEVGRTLLDVCYRAELRPEARNRADTIFQLQRAHFRERLAPVLEEEAAVGRLAREADAYRFVSPPGERERRRWRRYFSRSKVRATARWLKHVITFDNWLPYVVRKVERRTGTRVELTSLERRAPLIFLWPRAIRVLTARPEREERP